MIKLAGLYSPNVLITRPPASFLKVTGDQKLRYDLEWPNPNPNVLVGTSALTFLVTDPGGTSALTFLVTDPGGTSALTFLVTDPGGTSALTFLVTDPGGTNPLTLLVTARPWRDESTSIIH